jgi:hypothetical protein
MMDMRTEIAKAMAEAHGFDWDGQNKSREYANQDHWLKAADAAIVVIRPSIIGECAKVAEDYKWEPDVAEEIAKAIRALAE